MDKSIILFNTVRQPKTSLQKESLDHEQSVLFFLQRILPRSFLGSEGKRPCPSMIKSSLEFYPRRMARTVPLSFSFSSQPYRERLALSSIVLSRRCGLVCAKSSEIIDTSSSTLATWTVVEMLFLSFFLFFFLSPLSFIPLPNDSFYRATCTTVFRSLVCPSVCYHRIPRFG